MMSSRVSPPALHRAYRMAQIDENYLGEFVERALPLVVAVVDGIPGNLEYDDRDDVVAELTLALWTAAQTLVGKEFSSGERLMAYLIRRLRAQARSLIGVGSSQVIDVGVDFDPVSGGVELTGARTDEADRRQWIKEYVKRNIRFTGARKTYCLRLVTRGRYALRGTVNSKEEKFFTDYVSVLSRMGYGEYAKA